MHTAPARLYLLAVAAAAVYAAFTLAALFGIDCGVSRDPQRFCVWWGHSWLPTAVGLPAVLAFGCYASAERVSPRPAILAALLVALTCLYLRGAAAQVPYWASSNQTRVVPSCSMPQRSLAAARTWRPLPPASSPSTNP